MVGARCKTSPFFKLTFLCHICCGPLAKWYPGRVARTPKGPHTGGYLSVFGVLLLFLSAMSGIVQRCRATPSKAVVLCPLLILRRVHEVGPICESAAHADSTNTKWSDPIVNMNICGSAARAYSTDTKCCPQKMMVV